ncbi:MAG: conjugal transfer protein TraH, partial [Candidatus Tectomicrobia bacterium]|nr:conjugal transfer protein TraH [Candidatus Tectomicrobia bacterium]
MNRLVTIPVLIVLLALNPTLAAADLFDDAVDALTNQNMQAASLDNLGQALRGGLAAGYPQYTPGATPLHGFEISTPCGSFSLGTGFMDQLSGMLDPSAIISEIQSTATSLIGASISQLPMTGLCYAAPTMCDVVKNLQNFVKDMVQFKGLSCQQAESMLTGLGGKIRKQVESKCVAKQLASSSTMTVQKAEEACAGSASAMRQGITEHAPAGQTDGNARLIEDTLTRAGADQEIKDFARELLGEVEITGDADAGIDVDIQAPKKRLHDEYEKERQQIYNDLYESANIVGAGNPLPADKRKTISLPGMAMPDAVLRGVYDIGQIDPSAYNDYMGKLASNIALVKLSWKVNETR